MKVVKPIKVPVLARVIEHAGEPLLHVAAMLAFPFESPRALLDEMGFWQAVRAVLGEAGVIDESATKGAAEVLVAGAFHSPNGVPTTQSFARVKLGAVDKRIAVLGDRHWQNGVPTTPKPFVTMPLTWRRAFGGPSFAKNPHGLGADLVEIDGKKLQPLPNLEQYGQLIRSPSDRPEPAGLGPMDVSFPQRLARGGTYDEAWRTKHYPGLPADALATFFNLAPDDQWQTSGPFRGDEPFLLENLHPTEARLEGALPGLTTRAFVTLTRGDTEAFVEVVQRCDTVWLFPETKTAVVVFHGTLPVATDDAGDVKHLVVGCELLGEPRTPDHYREALLKRLDRDEGGIDALSDSDLMPPLASGVAPNFDGGEVATWLASKGRSLDHARTAIDDGLAQGTAQAASRGPRIGLDLVKSAPEPPPPPPDPRDLDAVAEHLRELQRQGKEQRANAEVQRARGLERARALAAAGDRDFDADVEAAEAKAALPPELPSVAFARLNELKTKLDAIGAKNERLDRMLASDDITSRLAELDRLTVDGYRNSAHLTEAKPRKTDDELAAMRALVETSLETGASLAERDLTGADLRGLDLSNRDLRGAMLAGANLEGCDLRGANLERAVLAKANLLGATLDGASLAGANLGRAELRGASLEGGNLARAILAHASLSGARFVGANLEAVDWLEVTFGAADFTRANLAAGSFVKSDLRGATFVGASLDRATLLECNLDGARFDEASLGKATMVRCRGENTTFRRASLVQTTCLTEAALPGADFTEANLSRACFRTTALAGATFHGATLDGADLSECDLSAANLERAKLIGTKLIRANLVGANLVGADLFGAMLGKARLAGTNFTGANLFQADLARAVGDHETRMDEANVERARFEPKARTEGA